MVSRGAALGVLLGLLVACGGQAEEDASTQQGVPDDEDTSSGGVASGAAAGAAGAAGANGAAAGTAGAADDCVLDETLPSCSFTESCTDTHLECSVSADCTIAFEEPVSPSHLYLECEYLPYSDWWNSETGLEVYLSAAACDAWHAADEPRIRLQANHSCIE